MRPGDGSCPRLNALAREKSPYLLDHAANPVDWLPWGDEAFEAARRQDKPIFLSIGYSTCHWCHVMARESFEDPEVAALLNDAFVPVKVDREERPDIDHIYITVCQMMTGSAGWPLTIIMTPEARPFFAATYLPRESRLGRVGLVDLVPRVKQLWMEQRSRAQAVADEMAALVARQVSAPGADGAKAADRRAKHPGEAIAGSALDQTYRALAARFDEANGGFGTAPKFPTPHNLAFLLRYGRRTGDRQAVAMVNKTLDAMRRGGIYDHLGFGIHRYSTDELWLVPHFEKMLYDQALVAMAFTEAFLATGEPRHRKTAEEILAYVLRDLASPEGAFYSAEDADSEGEEGKFYVWTAGELREAAGPGDADLVARAFGVTAEGNVIEPGAGLPPGANVLKLAGGPDPQEAEAAGRLEAARRRLLAARDRRVRPRRDDKVLADWNGLMIAALALAAQAFGEPRYARAAAEAAGFILTEMRTADGRLVHRWRDGQAGIPGTLDDYASVVWGLIELYEATFEVKHLRAALDLNRLMLDHFSDPNGAGFYFTADDGERLLVRMKETYDGAIPAGNSVALLNLVRLARLTGDHRLEDRAAALAAWLSSEVAEAPQAHVAAAVALDFAVGPAIEVAIVGDPEAADTIRMTSALRSAFVPNKVVVLRTATGGAEIQSVAPWVGDLKSLDGKATAYVCRGFTCGLPTTDVGTMMDQLGRWR